MYFVSIMLNFLSEHMIPSPLPFLGVSSLSFIISCFEYTSCLFLQDSSSLSVQDFSILKQVFHLFPSPLLNLLMWPFPSVKFIERVHWMFLFSFVPLLLDQCSFLAPGCWTTTPFHSWCCLSPLLFFFFSRMQIDSLLYMTPLGKRLSRISKNQGNRPQFSLNQNTFECFLQNSSQSHRFQRLEALEQRSFHRVLFAPDASLSPQIPESSPLGGYRFGVNISSVSDFLIFLCFIIL